MPNESYHLKDLETLFLSYGLSNKPINSGLSAAHIYFRRVTSARHILGFLKEDSLAYFQTSEQPSTNRRVAIIFENHLGCMILVVCYEHLKSNWQKRIQNSVQNAYESVAVYGFATTKKGRKYLVNLFSGFSGPFTCITTDQDILLVESARMLLFNGNAHYQANCSKIILEQLDLIAASHKVHCIQQFNVMLHQVASEEDQEKLLELLAILIKYRWLKTKRDAIDQSNEARQQLLLDTQLQKECFVKDLPDVSSLGRYFAVTGPLQLLDLIYKLTFSGSKPIIAELTEEKVKQENALRTWTAALTSKIQQPSRLEAFVQTLYYCYQRSPVCLSGNLAVFFLHHFLPRLDPLAFFIGAGFGIWQLYTQNFFLLPFMIAISFITESLYRILQNEQLDLTHARWHVNKLDFSVSTLLKGILLFIASLFSLYLLDINPLIAILSSVSITFFFEKLFSVLMHDIAFSSQHEKTFFEFLFLQICLACVLDIQNRYAQIEETKTQFDHLPDSKNIKTDFSWRWWFFDKDFDVTHHNASHTRVMHCALPDEPMNLTGDLRNLPFCTLQTEQSRLAVPIL